MIARSTMQRQLVLDAVRRLYHPTAEEVYGAVARDHPTVSKATVYRNLNHLADAGHIRRVKLLDAAVRFDGTVSSHCHAQCRGCGKVLDVMEEDCPGSFGKGLIEQGFLVEDREVLLTGLCAQCQRRPRDE